MPKASRVQGKTDINYINLPFTSAGSTAEEDLVFYRDHVRQRITLFCLLIHQVVSLCQRFQPTGSWATLLTDTAGVQVGSGTNEQAKGKVDAAHFCNTSFMLAAFLGKLPPGRSCAALTAYCVNLQNQSGATGPQLKIHNVGPDKVIDSFQTDFKNAYLHRIQRAPATHDAVKLWREFVAGLELHLATSSSSSFSNRTAKGYPAAIAALETVRLVASHGISWSVEEEFVLQKQAIDALT